jgi:hypothetical protein
VLYSEKKKKLQNGSRSSYFATEVIRPVRPGVRLTSGAHNQISIFCQTIAGVLMCGALSDERTVCNLLVIIAVGLRQSSHSRVQVLQNSRPYFTVSFETPQPGKPGPHIYIPQEQVGPVT